MICDISKKDVGADASVCPKLTEIGDIVNTSIYNVEKIYENVKIEANIIMPNHIHMIIKLDGQRRPPLQKIIQGIKSVSTRKCNKYGYQKIWQRNYYEHIIRNEEELYKIMEYIENNPLKWFEDKYYIRTE